MAVCINCGKDVVTNYHVIYTKRKTKHYLCFECSKEQARGRQKCKK